MKIVYFTHSLASCWNHGNAHFLRGVLRELIARGHDVQRLRAGRRLEPRQPARRSRRGGARRLSRRLSRAVLIRLRAVGRDPRQMVGGCRPGDRPRMERARPGRRASAALRARRRTLHPALPRHAPPRRQRAGGDARLRPVAAMTACWPSARRCRRSIAAGAGAAASGPGTRRPTLRRFHPPAAGRRARRARLDRQLGRRRADRRSWRTFLLRPAREAGLPLDIYGVRYPDEAQGDARPLRRALSRLGAERRARRRSSRATSPPSTCRGAIYSTILPGIPTIRVFEALACGIPLVSAPWEDAEGLFRPGRTIWSRATARR